MFFFFFKFAISELVVDNDNDSALLCITQFRDISTQVDDWQSSSGFEIEQMIAFRLSAENFPLIAHEPIHLRRDYHMREMYKSAGATYNGAAQQWSFLPGVDLRRVINEHPEWITEPHVVRRHILLRMLAELEEEPLLH